MGNGMGFLQGGVLGGIKTMGIQERLEGGKGSGRSEKGGRKHARGL